MRNEIVALAQQYARRQAQTAIRRAAVPAAFGLIAAILFLFAVGGLFAALFFWLEPDRGPAAAALICAGVALVLAILMVLPLRFTRRRPPPPVYEGSLPQFVSLMAKTAPISAAATMS